VIDGARNPATPQFDWLGLPSPTRAELGGSYPLSGVVRVAPTTASLVFGSKCSRSDWRRSASLVGRHGASRPRVSTPLRQSRSPPSPVSEQRTVGATATLARARSTKDRASGIGQRSPVDSNEERRPLSEDGAAGLVRLVSRRRLAQCARSIGASNVAWSGGPGDSHPRAPTDPGVTVSRHRALLTAFSRRGPSATGRTGRARVLGARSTSV
jgi:hypothetical protein